MVFKLSLPAIIINNMKGNGSKEDKEQIRVLIDYNKQNFLLKFPLGTKVLYLEEFLKRTMKLKPTETLYLFVREQRKLLTPAKCIDEYVK
jgi:hypothetical protein